MAQAGIARGARILVRDAEWLVRNVERTSSGGQAIYAVGLSEIVKEKESVFLSEVEQEIRIVDPAETKLVADTSPFYRDTRLYIESLLRQTPPTDERLYVGHKGAMDVVPYQLDPALQALKQPRHRILIADAVGLGKTIECGILLSELIKRGEGKRILVLTVKSMMTQFQKELWARFTIPLVRLDSVGIQRVRNRIPTNHNPFFYFDRTIISIDTLKQEAEYRNYLENCYWDIIVIDEAHNVAERGTNSMRSKLAKLLASRSDTLILLSATPHDGRKRSFASIMNMLNPTAIANPDEYGPQDIKGLFIRRFKKDIKAQVAHSFQERKIEIARCPASPVEEVAYDLLAKTKFTKLDDRRDGTILFQTVLEKALFSSPAACHQTVQNRKRRLAKEDAQGYEHDLKQLDKLSQTLEGITPALFSRYQKLLQVIRGPAGTDGGLAWNPADPKDRLVIFTERIETLAFLEKNLKKDLKLRDEQVAPLHGTMPDVDMQAIVERFGNESDPVRLLIASDVASEGINLHYLCHKLIHFDIPWSLLVFQQRNGRIDRYGQERQPQIVYLMTQSENQKVRGDTRILELLVEKDKEVQDSIGDPSEFTGFYDAEAEEAHTAQAIAKGLSSNEFERQMTSKPPDPLAILMGDMEMPSGGMDTNNRADMPTLFADDYAYAKDAIGFLRGGQPLQVEFDDLEQTVTLTAPSDFEYRKRFLPREILSDDSRFVLTTDRKRVSSEIARCRKEEHAWPRVHLLWDQHPLMNWLNDKVLSAFGRHEAPVLTLTGALDPDESVFIVFGLIANRKSQPLIHRWMGVCYRNSTFKEVLDFSDILRKVRLRDRQFPNPGHEIDSAALAKHLPLVVEKTRETMSRHRRQFDERIRPQLMEHLDKLNELRIRHQQQLELQFGLELTTQQMNRKERERREKDRIFNEYRQWIEDSMTTEDNPYVRIVAVLKGGA